MNKVERIKNVVVIIQWDDDSLDMDWSTMRMSDLCMAEKVLSIAVEDVLSNE